MASSFKNHYERIQGQGFSGTSHVIQELTPYLSNRNEFLGALSIRHPDLFTKAGDGRLIPSPEAQAIYHIGLFERAGRKVFFVEQALALLLLNTKLTGVLGDSLQFPFENFMLQIHPDTFPHELEGVPSFSDSFYVHVIRNPDSITLSILTSSVAIDVTFVNGYPQESEHWYRWDLDLRNPLQSEVAKNMKSFKKDVHLYSHDSDSHKEFFNMLPDRILYLVLNTVLYINDPGNKRRQQTWADINPAVKKGSSKQRKRVLGQLKKTRILRMVLGHDIVLPRAEREAYQNAVSWNRGPVNTRFWVTGHWHSYWTGPRDGDRERIVKWIRPYMKGREGAPESNSRYVLRQS